MEQNEISRFQPLQDAKQALIKEIEKLSSWTYIHPDEQELNEVLITAMVSATMLVERVEQAVNKYEN